MPVLVLSIIAFVLGFVGSMPLAGPIAVMVVSRAAEKRFIEARHFAFGAAISEGIYAGVAFFGFSTFLARNKALLPWSHGVTAVVLFIVGLQFIRWKPSDEPVVQEKPGKGAFVLGFTVSALNPTLLVTWSAVTTAIYSRQIVPMVNWYALPFAISAGIGIALWFVCIIGFLQRYGGRFPAALVMWIVRGMGLLLMLVAIWSAVDLVRKL